MTVRKVFTDHHGSELEIYPNGDGKLYIGINVDHQSAMLVNA